jgi:thymidylate synthase
LIPTFIETKTLPEAWFKCIYGLFEGPKGVHTYTIDRGSFEGHQRLEYDHVTVHIEYPGSLPLIPDVPQGVPAPTDMEYVERYLPYLMTNQPLQDNEEYTYGTYLERQIQKVIRMYKEGGHNTNQAYMTIGNENSIDQLDPPCLRGIDTRILNGKLHFIVYFRSWDLWAGFPSNLAAIQILKSYMADMIGVTDGELIANSKGLHLYDIAWDQAKAVLRRS